MFMEFLLRNIGFSMLHYCEFQDAFFGGCHVFCYLLVGEDVEIEERHFNFSSEGFLSTFVSNSR